MPDPGELPDEVDFSEPVDPLFGTDPKAVNESVEGEEYDDEEVTRANAIIHEPRPENSPPVKACNMPM